MNDCQPKCDYCVDAYNSECHCQESVYFGMFTGCDDKDLWWFVEKKMRFNKQRPKFDGKKY
nr:MAG TPA: hypothetical protein [Caudoviricetes sp.]